MIKIESISNKLELKVESDWKRPKPKAEQFEIDAVYFDKGDRCSVLPTFTLIDML